MMTKLMLNVKLFLIPRYHHPRPAFFRLISQYIFAIIFFSQDW